MKNKLYIILTFFSLLSYGQIQHCGYDFTSYLVVDVHENGKTENIKNLKITVVDDTGKPLVNVNNLYSWNQGNQIMTFSQNYLVSKEGEKERYFFPYAKDNYYLSITTTFPVDNFSIKIEDSNGVYLSQTVKLYAFNMYILCSSENEKQQRSFGPRTNRPIEVVLEKK